MLATAWSVRRLHSAVHLSPAVSAAEDQGVNGTSICSGQKVLVSFWTLLFHPMPPLIHQQVLLAFSSQRIQPHLTLPLTPARFKPPSSTTWRTTEPSKWSPPSMPAPDGLFPAQQPNPAQLACGLPHSAISLRQGRHPSSGCLLPSPSPLTPCSLLPLLAVASSCPSDAGHSCTLLL